MVINYAADHDAAAERCVADIEAAGGTASRCAGDVADEADVRRLFDAAAELGELSGSGVQRGHHG